ncbi:MAG: hypothetical protein R3F61_26550 [Myxococcota bacterium]
MIAAVGLASLMVPPADAGRKKPKPSPEPEIEVVQPKPVRSKPVPLFDAQLPLDTGPVPEGLANLTAQGCAACHFDSHAGWMHSAHASGWRDPAFVSAVQVAGTPACTVCHLPMVAQRPELLTFDMGDVDKPVTGPNPAFNASLRLEGVTCAACHVRNGKVVGPRPPEEVGKAPHPLVWSKELAGSEGCAACHQLTWTGANAAFYDTYGEWKASPHAAAGIGCVDCHGGPGASGRSAGLDHAMPAGTDRAVSVLLELASLALVRGDEPVPLAITVQNTGAGHAFPTGSPFKGVQLAAWLEGPPDKKNEPTRTEPFTAHLSRTLSDGPPWNTEADTRIPAGGEARFETTLALEHGAPEGDWALHVQLVETVRGAPTERVVFEQVLPVDVE